VRTKSEYVDHLWLDAYGLKGPPNGHGRFISAVSLGVLSRSNNYFILGHTQSQQFLPSHFGVTPAGLLPALRVGHATACNDILVGALFELDFGGAYAIATNPAFHHKYFGRQPLGHGEKRFAEPGPPSDWDNQEQDYAARA
jgi:hypothetical protein